MTSRYKAMVFDMDGTLIDSMWSWRGAFREFIQERELVMPEELVCIPECSCGQAARLLAPQLGEETYEEAVEAMFRIVDRHYLKDVPARPGAAEWVKRLKERGYLLAVATATPLRYANHALIRLGFQGLFDLVVSCEEIGLGKKDPAFFTRVAERLGVQAEECVMFEDALYAIRSAKKAGLTVCAIEDYYAWRDKEDIRREADGYIACYEDLMERES